MKHVLSLCWMTILSLVMLTPVYAHVPVMGHRGGVWGVENTAGCFRAGAQWFDGLEMDTKLTKDSVIVCFHDADFSLFYKDKAMTTKYTPEESNIRNHTLAELQAMPITQRTCAGVFTDTICTMATYLDICRENNVIAYVEVKWVDNYLASNSAAGMPHVMKLIKDHGMLDHCIIMSGIEKCINWVRERPEYDSIPVQYLGMTGSSNPSFATVKAWAETHEGDIDPECYQITSKKQVQECHDKNIKVACWNVTNTSSYNLYKSFGVDYITVDSLRPIFLKDYTPRTGFLDVKHIPAPPTENPDGWATPEDMYQGLAKDIIDAKAKKRLAFVFYSRFSKDSVFSEPTANLDSCSMVKDIKYFDIAFFNSYESAKWKWLLTYIDARLEADGVAIETNANARQKQITYNLAAFFADTKWDNPLTADFTHCGAHSAAFIPYWKYAFCTPSGWYPAVLVSSANQPIRKYENGRLAIHVGDRVYSPSGARVK